MKSQYTLLVELMHEMCTLNLGVLPRDIEELTARISGDRRFPETVLPSLDTALLSGLKGGTLEPIPGFKNKKGTALPEFLFGLWKRIFSPSGELFDTPDISAIRCIRQISNLFKKVFEVCDESIVTEHFSRFIDTDRALCSVRPDTDIVSTVFSRLFGRALAKLYYVELAGKHGPGAVADKLDSVARWDFSHVEPRLIRRFGEDFFFSSRSEYLNRYPVPTEQFGNVIAVPKTALKPRLISVEPSAHQYAQQSVMAHLYRLLSDYPCVNIFSQERNQSLAQLGSRDGSLATLDLSEASDRLSMQLLREVTRNHEWFLDLLLDCRTKAVTVDGHGLVPLNKFASMGSALTFPIQVMVFATLAVCGLVDAGKIDLASVSHKTLKRADFGVYGDDIIVPQDCALNVISRLESNGLVVNQAKSFWTGPFRESCGGDFVHGEDVSPIYVRRLPPTSRRDADAIISHADLAWKLLDRGFFATSEYVSGTITSIVGNCLGERMKPIGPLRAYGSESSQLGMGCISVPFGNYPKHRYNAALQVHQWKYPVFKSVRTQTVATDRARLSFALANVKGSYRTLRGGVPEVDPKALTHHGRPVASFLSYRWSSLNNWGS